MGSGEPPAAIVRAVLIDLDDTLFDHEHCAREALAGVRRLHDAFGGLDLRAFEQSHARILEELHHDVMAGRIELDAARIERFRRLYLAAGIEAAPDLAARAAAAYRARYLEARRAVHGAGEFLAAVRARATVVVVSNNLLEEQRDKLRHCGLERHVDVLVVSEEVGVSKPDPWIFQLALARANAGPGEAVMVGDSWANDVEGARAAGIRAVWFNRDGRDAPDPDVPVLRSFELSETRRVLFGESS